MNLSQKTCLPLCFSFPTSDGRVNRSRQWLLTSYPSRVRGFLHLKTAFHKVDERMSKGESSVLEGIEIIKPGDIEKKSFAMITELLGERTFPENQEPIIKRVIHTTADFEYADTLKIREDAVQKALEAIQGGCGIVTDTKMAAAGINKKSLGRFGGQVVCFMDDEAIAVEAAARGITRAALCMDRAATDARNRIFVIGNAPTALLRLCELLDEGKIAPSLVVGVPVGFVNVVESKELLKRRDVPYIVADGRKGGSNVAAAIVNALLYMLGRD